MLLSACPQVAPETPKLTTKVPIWNPDARTESLVRGEGKNMKVMRCSDRSFDDLICTTRDAYVKAQKELIEMSYRCEQWSNE